MLICVPKGICSWTYLVRGSPGGDAALDFDFLSEQGAILFAGREYRVRKHGPFSGQWSLELDEHPIAVAIKPNALFRKFKIAFDGGKLLLQAQTLLTNSFDLERNGQLVGQIRPMHAFTRRAIVECNTDVPEVVVLFAFWLVVMLWRRAAQSSSSGAT